jgi:hypothetical protein
MAQKCIFENYTKVKTINILLEMIFNQETPFANLISTSKNPFSTATLN